MRLSIPNWGTHAWLRCYEQRRGIRIGQRNHRNAQLDLELSQDLNFSNEPRAFWEPKKEGKKGKFIWNDFGLFGPGGPLPELLTEQLMHARQGYVFTLFINRLIQRIAQLYYRAWSMQRPECEVRTAGQQDQFSLLMANICGDANSMAPHFLWLRPMHKALPLYIRKLFGVEAELYTANLHWYKSDHTLRLGSGKLNECHLGSFIACYSRVIARAKLIIKTSDIQNYRLLTNKRSNHYKKLHTLISQFLPTDARCELSIISCVRHPNMILGDSSLSHSRLSSHQQIVGGNLCHYK